jgi:hypothetical protein
MQIIIIIYIHAHIFSTCFCYFSEAVGFFDIGGPKTVRQHNQYSTTDFLFFIFYSLVYQMHENWYFCVPNVRKLVFLCIQCTKN